MSGTYLQLWFAAHPWYGATRLLSQPTSLQFSTVQNHIQFEHTLTHQLCILTPACLLPPLQILDGRSIAVREDLKENEGGHGQGQWPGASNMGGGPGMGHMPGMAPQYGGGPGMGMGMGPQYGMGGPNGMMGMGMGMPPPGMQNSYGGGGRMPGGPPQHAPQFRPRANVDPETRKQCQVSGEQRSPLFVGACTFA